MKKSCNPRLSNKAMRAQLTQKRNPVSNYVFFPSFDFRTRGAINSGRGKWRKEPNVSDVIFPGFPEEIEEKILQEKEIIMTHCSIVSRRNRERMRCFDRTLNWLKYSKNAEHALRSANLPPTLGRSPVYPIHNPITALEYTLVYE